MELDGFCFFLMDASYDVRGGGGGCFASFSLFKPSSEDSVRGGKGACDSELGHCGIFVDFDEFTALDPCYYCTYAHLLTILQSIWNVYICNKYPQQKSISLMLYHRDSQGSKASQL